MVRQIFASALVAFLVIFAPLAALASDLMLA
jgi:hypothetical protein